MNSLPIRCLITAGPTREHLDPVRFFSNGSSGKMGYALAEAARDRGWIVDLVSGPVELAAPAGVRVHRVVSAAEMLQAAEPLFNACDIAIFCAAVADYRPARRAPQKIKKHGEIFMLEMAPTVDIASSLCSRKGGRISVGFAAETENIERNALAKLENKNFDWVVANDVSVARPAMGGDENEIILFGRDGRRHPFGPAPKARVAAFILDTIVPL